MQAINEINSNDRLKQNLMPWLVCFSATLFFFYEFIQGNMFASIAANIMEEYQIQADKMAWLSSMYYFSNVIFLFVAGILLDRFSIKKTIIIAMFLCVVSTFVFSWSHSFYLALFCRFLTGIGSAFCFLGPVRLAAQWFPPGRMAFVTGVIVTMAMTGGMLAQYPLTILITQVGWRHAVQDIAILGTVMLAAMIFWIKEKPTNAAAQVHQPQFGIQNTIKTVYLNTQYLRAAVFTSLMNIGIAVFGAMMGRLYLEQRLGIPAEQASVINSMLFLGAIIGGPLTGGLSDKIGMRILPMKIGAIASLLTVLALLYLPVSYHLMLILFFLLGLFTSAQVISYALVAESSPPAQTATAVSVISILTQGGYILYQNVFSHLLTSHSQNYHLSGPEAYSLVDYQYAASILPIGLFLAFIILSGLKETYCKQQNNKI